MTILNLGTYPPRQCGIATFSTDFRNSLKVNGCDIDMMAISDENSNYQYPPEVVFSINQDNKKDYYDAADFINNHIDITVIQHEYGIFGGKDGEFLLELTKLLHKPYILVCHTVLPRPTKHQKELLFALCQRASGIVAMTRSSAQLLVNLYEAPSELIHIIAHGVPNFRKKDQNRLKKKYGLEGKQIISTFGLIGPGKGLEIGIQAVSKIVKDFPQAVYLILGQTHPVLKKFEGEKYRHMLEDLVADLELYNNVHFVNKYLSDTELGEYLYLTDIYLSPYPNKDQAVSGTMAFAIGCGRAIVSTPYAYAREMLSGGRGLLSKGTAPEELGKLLASILADPVLKGNLQNRALKLGRTWNWANIGKQYLQLFENILFPEDGFVERQNINYVRL